MQKVWFNNMESALAKPNPLLQIDDPVGVHLPKNACTYEFWPSLTLVVGELVVNSSVTGSVGSNGRWGATIEGLNVGHVY